MSRHRCTAQVRDGHKGPALVYDFDPGDVWPELPRYFVRGTMNGAAFEGEIGLRRGVRYTCVPADLLVAAGAAAGSVVQLELEPREPTAEERKQKTGLVWARRADGPAPASSRRVIAPEKSPTKSRARSASGKPTRKKQDKSA